MKIKWNIYKIAVGLVHADDAIRWLIASLKWVVLRKYIDGFRLCSFHNTIESNILLDTCPEGRRRKKKEKEGDIKEAERANKQMPFYCMRFMAGLSPTDVVSDNCNKMRSTKGVSASTPLQQWTILCVGSRAQSPAEKPSKSKLK